MNPELFIALICGGVVVVAAMTILVTYCLITRYGRWWKCKYTKDAPLINNNDTIQASIGEKQTFPGHSPDHTTNDIPDFINNPSFDPDEEEYPIFKFPSKTLVIGADASSRYTGGYLINQFSSKVEFYSTECSNLPWTYRRYSFHKYGICEIEMKNLFSALLIWEDIILQHRNFVVFTDNSAIQGRNNVHGIRVRNYIAHLEKCEGVVHLKTPHIYMPNSIENEDIFDQFMIPADYLSRRDEDSFLYHVMEYYPYFQEQDFAKIEFSVVQKRVEYWSTNSCESCGFHISGAGSLKRIRNPINGITNSTEVNFGWDLPAEFTFPEFELINDATNEINDRVSSENTTEDVDILPKVISYAQMAKRAVILPKPRLL